MLHDFEKEWDSIEDFKFKPPKEQPDWCMYAQKYSEWVDKTCQFNEDTTIIELNQTKLMLQEK